ncbi:hypothetical protein WJX74_005086 [Apatococcus lobatus]|uniref:Tr-type G domain-containing protein n=1 Tax=Apatococcus lobatus TaxID=904363 RepID=A0AAW1RVE3_9CHLO
MLGVDIDELDLGSRRKPVEWVIVAPPQSNGKSQQGERTQGSRRTGGRRNAAARARRKAAQEAVQAENECDPADLSHQHGISEPQSSSQSTGCSSTQQPPLQSSSQCPSSSLAWGGQSHASSSQQSGQTHSPWVAQLGLHGSSPKHSDRQRQRQQQRRQQHYCEEHLQDSSTEATREPHQDADSENISRPVGRIVAVGSSCNYQPVLSNGKQRDDPGMFDETSIPGWTRDNEGAPSVFEEDLLVPKRRLTHAQASMSASAALPGFNDLGLIESGQLGLGSTHSGFSPLSANSGSQTFALGPPGNGSSSPFHPFDVVRQMSSCRASADSDKAQRSTGSQAFGEGSGELDDGVGDGMDYIAAEDDDGNVEYKLRLKNPSPVRFQQLVTQLKFRLSEGSGECYYYLGVQDDGKLVGLAAREQEISAAVLAGMAAEVGATSQLLQQLPVGQHRAALYMRVRRASVDHLTCADLCVAVAGAVDSGKSTLVAALTHGCEGRPRLDDGQGAARMAVLRHKHEIESGRTSSISQQLLGYDDEGRVLNYAGVAALTAAEIGVSARKVVHFLDLGGHAKFLKTALYGLTCLRPDYMLLCVEMGLGLEPAAREHLAVALAMRIPVALLLTKADLAQPGQLASSLDGLRETIVAAAAAAASGGIVNANGPGAEQCAPFLDTEAKARALAAEWSSLCPQHAAGKSMSLVVPIFPLSCVSGIGLAPLHAFLAHLNLPLLPLSDTPAAAASIGSIPPAPLPKSPSAAASMGSNPSAAVAASSSATASPQLPCQAYGTAPPADHQHGAAPRLAYGIGLTAALQKPAVTPSPANPSRVIFQVDNTFEVRGVGSVVSGMVLCGQICVGAQLLMGPTEAAAFTLVNVTCIQRCQVSVGKLEAGERATLAIHSIADADQGAANNTPEPVSSLETRAVWRPCIPDNPYDHPLIVPSSSQESPATSPLPGSRSKSSLQQALCNNFSSVTMPPGSSSGWADASEQQNGPGRHRLCAFDSSDPAHLMHGSTAAASTPELHAASSSPLQADTQAQEISSKPHLEGSIEQQQQQRRRGQRTHTSTGPAASANSSRSTDASDGQETQHKPASPSMQADAQGRYPPAVTAMPDSQTAANGSRSTSPLPQEAYQIHDGAGTVPLKQQPPERSASPAAPSTLSPPKPRQDSTGEMEWLPGGEGISFEDGADHLQRVQSPVPETSASCPLNPPRKGAVLIDADAEPRVAWEFEAILVLLSGHWPARGLLSGHWPPIDRPDGPSSLGSGYYDSGSDSAGGSSWNDKPRALRTSSRASKRRSTAGHGYAPVVHCGSVRQAARVVAMQEVARAPLAAWQSQSDRSLAASPGSVADMQQDQASSACLQPTSVPLGPAFAAAAVLTASGSGAAVPSLHGISSPNRSRPRFTSGPVPLTQDLQGADDEASKEAQDIGCVVRVTLRFLHHPEWLQEDARIIVRDRTDGCTSGQGGWQVEMAGGLQLTVQTEERLDPAEAEILMRKIALIERTGSKSENVEDLRAQLRSFQSVPPDDDFAEYHVVPRLLQDKKAKLLLLPEAYRDFYKRVSLPSALVSESKKVIVALYDGMRRMVGDNAPVLLPPACFLRDAEISQKLLWEGMTVVQPWDMDDIAPEVLAFNPIFIDRSHLPRANAAMYEEMRVIGELAEWCCYWGQGGWRVDLEIELPAGLS